MLQLNILLLIIALLIYITISTLLYKEVKYIVVTEKQTKTRTLKILVTRVLAPLFI